MFKNYITFKARKVYILIYRLPNGDWLDLVSYTKFCMNKEDIEVGTVTVFITYNFVGIELTELPSKVIERIKENIRKEFPTAVVVIPEKDFMAKISDKYREVFPMGKTS